MIYTEAYTHILIDYIWYHLQGHARIFYRLQMIYTEAYTHISYFIYDIYRGIHTVGRRCFHLVDCVRGQPKLRNFQKFSEIFRNFQKWFRFCVWIWFDGARLCARPAQFTNFSGKIDHFLESFCRLCAGLAQSDDVMMWWWCDDVIMWW